MTYAELTLLLDNVTRVIVDMDWKMEPAFLYQKQTQLPNLIKVVKFGIGKTKLAQNAQRDGLRMIMEPVLLSMINAKLMEPMDCVTPALLDTTSLMEIVYSHQRIWKDLLTKDAKHLLMEFVHNVQRIGL